MMLVLFRTQGTDWDRFQKTLGKHRSHIESMGCRRIEAYRNRKHPEEWVMLQEWPDKPTFDAFAKETGPALDQESGVRWTDVSTWVEGGTG
jgi:quinol monooxygenase YgiN